LNKGDFTETTLPIVWLLFTLLAVETYNLSSKFPTKIHQLRYPASRTSFSGAIASCRNTAVVLKLRSYLCKVLHVNGQNLMLIDPPNDWATACCSCWKYSTEH